MKFYADYVHNLQWVEGLTRDVINNAPDSGAATDLFRADLAGLLSTAYVAAFECCVKTVFYSFAASKHKILSNLVGHHFEQINSKIKWQALEGYAAQFGLPYKLKFQETLRLEEIAVISESGRSLKETYSNLINWRHAFAHSGQKLATLEEVCASYPIAKRMISVLDNAMSS